MNKLPDITKRIGEDGATAPTTPAPSSKPASTRMRAAKKAVDRLFAWCLMPDAGDAEVYLAGAIAILAEYPVEVMEKIADPRTGTRILKDYPSLVAIRRACDGLYEPLAREYERQAAHDSHVAGLIARRKRSAEEQARVDVQVTRAKREFQEAMMPVELPRKDGTLSSTGPPDSLMSEADMATNF